MPHAFKLYSYLTLSHPERSSYPWERRSRVPFQLASSKWILSMHLKSQTQFSATICSRTTTVLGLWIFAKRLVYSRGWGYGHHVSIFFAYARSYALEHPSAGGECVRKSKLSLFWWTSISVVGQLLQPPHNRAVHGLYAGDAPSQHSSEPPSCDPDRYKMPFLQLTNVAAISVKYCRHWRLDWVWSEPM